MTLYAEMDESGRILGLYDPGQRPLETALPRGKTYVKIDEADRRVIAFIAAEKAKAEPPAVAIAREFLARGETATHADCVRALAALCQERIARGI